MNVLPVFGKGRAQTQGQLHHVTPTPCRPWAMRSLSVLHVSSCVNVVRDQSRRQLGNNAAAMTLLTQPTALV